MEFPIFVQSKVWVVYYESKSLTGGPFRAPTNQTAISSKEINIILHRLACQLLENHLTFENTVLIGIQPRGKFVAQRLNKILKEEYKVKHIDLGFLDITFYRDDFRRGDKTLEATKTNINFLVEDKNVVLIDDVLYTGRSINAAAIVVT